MDEFGFELMMFLLGFLLGFKISARLGDSQLERMRKIWNPPRNRTN